MTSFLSAPYQLDKKTHIWSRPGYDSIAYNDGNEIEQRILEIIVNAEDCTVLSSELRNHCTDWASLYHLSGSRANILRPLEASLKGRILEIGAGCGAITRYLGECGGDVLALEGTLRRASICRARTRDLPNVTVVAETFSAFETAEKFDVVTLIGVLEYASMFVEDAAPDEAMLKRAKSFLKPGGQLIIAIENQLGLKYFAGAGEDHVSTVAFGLEDRYRPGGVRTYGRQALEKLLKRSGLGATHILGCFPDYKFPVSIISELGFKDQAFDAIALAMQTVRRDPQLPAVLAFRPERVWKPLIENGLGLDLSNSFLAIARLGNETAPELNDHLAWHFSTERRAQFCKVTKFVKGNQQTVVVRPSRASDQYSLRTEFNGLSNDVGTVNPFHGGIALSTGLKDLVTRDGWSNHEVAELIEEYFTALRQFTKQSLQSPQFFEDCVSGRFIDALPQNVLADPSGNYQLIDTEWEWDRNVSPAFLLFRGLHTLTLSVTRIGRHDTLDVKTHLDFLNCCFASIGRVLEYQKFAAFCETEQVLQELVTGRKLGKAAIEGTLSTASINSPSTWDLLDQQKAALEKAGQLLHERLTIIHAQQDTIADRDHLIQAVTTSISWRVTRPLRATRRLFGSKWVASARRNSTAAMRRVMRSLRNAFAPPNRVCVCIHAFYPDLLPPILDKLRQLRFPVRLVITAPTDRLEEVSHMAKASGLEVDVLAVENRGRDLLPFLIALDRSRPRELILKLHTKKSPHRDDGDRWRNDMIGKLLAPESSERCFQAFVRNTHLGMVAPAGHILSIDQAHMGMNGAAFSRLKAKMTLSPLSRDEHLFSGGTMFYARKEALGPLMALRLSKEDFEEEASQIDGTLAHALERLIGTSVGVAGYHIASTDEPERPAQAQAGEFHPV